MTLFIRKDDGTGDFFPDRGGIDLIAISVMDTGYGEDDSDPDWIEVTYSRNETGPTPDRLDELVNSITDPIRVFPVDSSFALSDGTLISSVAGVAMKPTSANNPQPGEISTIYDTSDCEGAGWCVFASNGDEISFPSSVILYHELSHCLHFATGVTTSEPLAETDENDMRDVLGITHRDVDNHSGGCGGCPSVCCIVASISTGSAFSDEVCRLRNLRDSILRRGAVGTDFFDRLHSDYYAFSPQVCQTMAVSSRILDIVRERFVAPLVCGLELIRDFTIGEAPASQLGARLDEQLSGQSFSARPTAEALQNGRSFLASLLADDAPDLDGIRALSESAGSLVVEDVGLEADDLSALAGALQPAAFGSAHIRWALLEVVAIWFDAAIAVLSGMESRSAGAQLEERLIEWAGDIPLSPIWDEFTPFQADRAILELGSVLLQRRRSRERFCDRLYSTRPWLSPVPGRLAIAADRYGG